MDRETKRAKPPRPKGERKKQLIQKGKHGLWRVIFSRTGIIVLLLLLQIALMLTLYLRFRQYMVHYFSVSSVLTGVMVLWLMNSEGEPSAKSTWLILFLLFPLAGSLFYFYCRLDIGHRALRDRCRQINRDAARTMTQGPAFRALEEESPADAGLAAYLFEAGSFPVYDKTAVQYYPSGEDFFPALLDELERAERFIFLEYFIIEPGIMWDKVLEVLCRKADQGVNVRVLYDGTCEFFRVPRGYWKTLEEKNVRCRVFAPIHPFVSTHYNYRDHRKIAIVDGRIAFTGGVNMADEYINETHPFGQWKDTALRLEGEGVRSFTLLFLEMWHVSERGELKLEPWLSASVPCAAPTSGYVIPYGDNPLDDEPVGEWVYTHILSQAKHYVHIMTPYLILDSELENALRFAARRGVEVSIILPHTPDKRIPFALAKTHLPRLTAAGVKVYEYLPGFIHAKSFVSDGCRAVVGTINLDYRSLYHHFECAAFLYGEEKAGPVEADFQRTLADCQRITRDGAARPGLGWKLLGTLMKIIAPMM